MSENTTRTTIEERVKEFDVELRSLLGKYEIGIGAKVEITEDGRLAAKIVIIDAPVEEKKEEATTPVNPEDSQPAGELVAPVA